MQKEFQGLIYDNTVSVEVVCCFSKRPVQISQAARNPFYGVLPRRNDNANRISSQTGLSPEWAIFPGARVVEIPKDHFGMMHFSDKTTTEHKVMMDLLERAIDRARGKSQGEDFISPSQSGPVSQSMPDTQTPHYVLQYWLIPPKTPKTPKPAMLKPGDVVRLVAEAELDVRMTVNSGPILVANQIERLQGVEVKANASMELCDDGSVHTVKRAAQKGAIPNELRGSQNIEDICEAKVSEA
ncbi:hypothetical protein F5X99DRAFT_389581 [Biscogniauxia marginata]|nr:hypothetical protein F5X99DRAFT_389581 [Biscogniauxia marginata]